MTRENIVINKKEKSSVVSIANDGMFSPGVSGENLMVAFLYSSGRFAVDSPEPTNGAAKEATQSFSRCRTLSLEYAQRFILAKISNSRKYLLRLNNRDESILISLKK